MRNIPPANQPDDGKQQPRIQFLARQITSNRKLIIVSQCRAIGLLGLAAAGYGARLYFETMTEQRAATEAKEREDAERRRRNAMLLDVYGDRESLEELEKAVQFYEQKK